MKLTKFEYQIIIQLKSLSLFLILILIFFVYHVYFFFYSPLNFPLYDYYPQHYFFFYSSLNFPLYYCHYLHVDDRLHYLQDHKLEFYQLTDQVFQELQYLKSNSVHQQAVRQLFFPYQLSSSLIVVVFFVKTRQSGQSFSEVTVSA